MCVYCDHGDTNKIRPLIAAKAIGLHCSNISDDSPEGIEPWVESVTREFVAVTKNTARPFEPCELFARSLVAGIKRAWAEISIEDKFQMSVSAGAVRLGGS